MPPQQEPILCDNPDRYVLFPIQHQDIWKMYKIQQTTIWFSEDIKFENNKREWEALTEPERKFLKYVISFFVASDGIVLENLGRRFCDEVQYPEARAFYSLQMAMENVHSETYSQFITTFIEDELERNEMFHAIDNLPSVGKKAQWAINWINDENSTFAQRLLAFAIVEGVFFSGAFCAVFWIKSRGKLSGFTQANDYIARDEGLHTDFAVLLYNNHVVNKLTEEKVHCMFSEAVDIEESFIDEALPKDLLGINARDMKVYIKYIANRLLKQLHYTELFENVHNPFDFTELGVVTTKSNFFEHDPTEYQQSAQVETSSEDPYAFLN